MLDDPLYTALIKTLLLVDDSNNRFFQRYGLGVTRYYALIHSAETPGLSLSLLTERLICTKGNTTRVIKSLENDGLLRRETDSADNRAARIFITPLGQERLDQARREYQAFSARRFACLSAAQKEALRGQLEALNLHLETLLREAV